MVADSRIHGQAAGTDGGTSPSRERRPARARETTNEVIVRRLAILVARQSWVRKLAMSTPVVRDVAWRFVGGDDLGSAAAAIRTLNARGIKGTLNFFGMHVHDRGEAITAAEEIIESLQRIHSEGLDSHASVKLTKIGLDIDEGLCRTQLARILDCAAEVGIFVRIDMEESAYVERTIHLFEEMLDRYGNETVGAVIQSYVRRHADDMERLIIRGASIRLVKGGYRERAEVVCRRRADIDASFERDIEVLLRRGRHPAIATHDLRAINRACAIQEAIGLDKGAFEFQMLYGVRPELQSTLVRDGYTVRCYVPYGGPWVGYVLGSLRRIPGGAISRMTGQGRNRPGTV